MIQQNVESLQFCIPYVEAQAVVERGMIIGQHPTQLWKIPVSIITVFQYSLSDLRLLV